MTQKQQKDRPLQWHPAFYAGIQIELADDAENLTFENEHQLGTKPMEIDVLVIKKEKNIPVRKNIGRIFRKYNIIEYKSPDDYLAIDDFYKVCGYACFYKADVSRADSIPVDEITISLVCSKYPLKLMKHLTKDRKDIIKEADEGIYYITGDIFPIQLIVTGRLSEDDNLWLRSLTNDLSRLQTVDRLTSEYEKHREDRLYRSVMNIIVDANKELFEEAKEIMDAIRELFKDEIEAVRKEYEEWQKSVEQANKKAMQEKEEAEQAKENAIQAKENAIRAKENAEQESADLANLSLKLLEENRMEDLKRIMTDKAYRKSLCSQLL